MSLRGRVHNQTEREGYGEAVPLPMHGATVATGT
jgi:hypothetical protein